MTEAEKIVKILQTIGCKIQFLETDIEFSDRNLISDLLYNRIIINEEEIRELLDGDIRAMSVSKDGVGLQLEKLLPLTWKECEDVVKLLYEIDARGRSWCIKNKPMIIERLRTLSSKHGLDFDKRAARILLNKAISNAKKNALTF